MGNIETRGQTGAPLRGCDRAIERIYLASKTGPPDIDRFSFSKSILGLVSCLLFLKYAFAT